MPLIPAPFSLEASQWTGNDGNWSTFLLGVGTPLQRFQVLPSTLSSEIWLPIPEGCTWIPSNVLPDCGASRGVEAKDGPERLGFLSNMSTTWSQIGLEYLGSEQNLYGSSGQAGLYGLDTVSFGANQSGYNLPEQVIAGIATQDFWLGSFGLGANPSQFGTVGQNVSSLLLSMKSANYTPSISFGYTAGASYREQLISVE